MDITNQGTIHCGLTAILLLSGMDPNIKDADSTPFILSIMMNRIPNAKLYIDAGVDPNITMGKDGATALYVAANHYHNDMVKLLIERGAGVNKKCIRGRETALSGAIEAGNIMAIELLLENGADYFECDAECRSSLQIAANYDNENVANFLVEKGNFNLDVMDKHARTALHVAAKNNSLKVAKILINAGANISLKTEDWETALSIAIKEKHKEMENLLRCISL